VQAFGARSHSPHLQTQTRQALASLKRHQPLADCRPFCLQTPFLRPQLRCLARRFVPRRSPRCLRLGPETLVLLLEMQKAPPPAAPRAPRARRPCTCTIRSISSSTSPARSASPPAAPSARAGPAAPLCALASSSSSSMRASSWRTCRVSSILRCCNDAHSSWRRSSACRAPCAGCRTFPGRCSRPRSRAVRAGMRTCCARLAADSASSRSLSARCRRSLSSSRPRSTSRRLARREDASSDAPASARELRGSWKRKLFCHGSAGWTREGPEVQLALSEALSPCRLGRQLPLQ